MSRSIKINLLIFLGTFFWVNALSQYYVKVHEDSIGLEVDSVVLSIDVNAGDIFWEVSKDSLTWTSLNQTNDSLIIRIDSSAYYRAILTDGTCYPVESARAFVAFNTINITGNTFVIDSLGGVYSLSSGIKLIVPPGAVNEDVTISIDLLDAEQANIKMPLDIYIGREFCTGIFCEPAETVFQKPIRVRVPALNYQNTDIPRLYEYNSSTEIWNKYSDPLICSDKEHYIEFSTINLLSVRIELIKDVFGFGKSNESKSEQAEIDCHEFVVLRVMDHDYVGRIANGQCYVSSENLQVEFEACKDKPVETAKIQEIGKNCIPVVTSSISKECLAKGETATLTIYVCIGGLPLENELVYIELPEGVTADSTLLNTDHSGRAEFTIRCNTDNLDKDTITYQVLGNYYLETINAFANGESETTNKNWMPIDITGTQTIGCSPIKYVRLPGTGHFRLTVNQTAQITCNCYDQNNQQIDCGDVVYSIVPGSSYPNSGALHVDPASGLVTALKPGVAGVYATASGVASNNYYSYSVAYEGDLHYNRVRNDQCACLEDTANPATYYTFTPWTVNTTLDLHFYFWLGTTLNETPSGDLDGLNSYEYTSVPGSYCHSDVVWFEPVDYIDNWYFANITTQDAMTGKEFFVDYCYWDYRGVEYGNMVCIEVRLKMISPSIIQAHVSYYWPHQCSGRVYPNDFELQ